MLKKVLVVLAAIIGVFAIVISLQPSEFRVARSMAMAVSAAKIFPHVNDLHAWEAWSPWAKMDPNAKSSFEGPEAGVGAVMRWDGNMQVGKGSMTIIESQPNKLVRFRMEFLKPMAGTDTAELTFQPQGNNQTVVTWAMFGKNNFMGKAVGLFMNCDKMVGDQFQKGLTQLESVSR
jgi:hypothetical protein